MTQTPTTTNLASELSKRLVERGVEFFRDVDYTIDGSHELANAFIHFALASDLSHNEFMRANNVRDIVEMPLSLRVAVHARQALLCAQKVQLVLIILADEIHQCVMNTQQQVRGERNLGIKTETPESGADFGFGM